MVAATSSGYPDPMAGRVILERDNSKDHSNEEIALQAHACRCKQSTSASCGQHEWKDLDALVHR
jgi:hypothetical protein